MIEELVQRLSVEWCEDLIRRSLEEDGVLQGDVSTRSIIDATQEGTFELRSREHGVVAGLHVLEKGSGVLGSFLLRPDCHDGDNTTGVIATLEGSIGSIRTAERTMLNILGYASGIATHTSKFVDALKGTDCVVCDTRKTTPGLRVLDKYAVCCGGGTHHRVGLHDAALFKDNHIADIPLDKLELQLGNAIATAHSGSDLAFVEVEVDTIEQLEVVLRLPVDIVLLDNMSVDMLGEAVVLRNNSPNNPLLEASGGITLDDAPAVAATGVDRIAVGGLVHRSKWLDIGLDAIDG